MIGQMTPESYLLSLGIDPKDTIFLTSLDGKLRKPNFIFLMQEYHERKLQELDYKLEKGDDPDASDFTD